MSWLACCTAIFAAVALLLLALTLLDKRPATLKPTEHLALLYGLPVIMDELEGTRAANWLSGWLLEIPLRLFGFNGALMAYNPEYGYPRALWDWLRGDFGEDES